MNNSRQHSSGKGDSLRPVDYKKWSDNWGQKFLFILGIFFALFFLVALFAGEIEGGLGGVNTFEVDTLPDVAP